MQFIRTNRLTIQSIILSVLIWFTGCQTTKIEYVDNDKLPEKEKYRIAKVYLKDGSTIEIDGHSEYKAKYRQMTNVIVYENYGDSKYIELNKIQKLKIEVYKENQGLTAVVILGGVVLLLAVLTIVAFSIQGIGPH